jgi:hypothetical protein
MSVLFRFDMAIDSARLLAAKISDPAEGLLERIAALATAGL